MSTPLRVLIVEDSEDDTQLMLRELRRGGYDPIFERVETADQMQAALNQQDWELILCDHALPVFSAPKALELLKRIALDIPFIEVSGKIGEETAVEMMRAGAHDYVMKGNLARLAPAVTRELTEAGIRRDHKRAQQEIVDLAKFPAESPDPVLRTAGDGTVIFANKAAGPLLDTWSCRVGQALPKQRAELVASVLVSGAREDVEIESDGRTFLVTFAPVVEAGYVNLYARDITERKRAEEQLELAVSRWESTFDAVEDMVAVIDTDYRIVLANRAMKERFKGVTVLGAFCYELIHGTDHPPETCRACKVFETGEPQRWEIQEEHLGGCWLDVATSPIKDERGRVRQIVHSVRDITERKQAEEKIEKSRHLLGAVIEAISDATMVIAADYRIVLANRAARDMAGVEDPVATGLRCHQVFRHRDVPCDGVEHPCPLVQVVAAKGPVVVKHIYDDAEGNEVLMEVAAAPIFNEAGGLVQIVQSCRDITNRVEE